MGLLRRLILMVAALLAVPLVWLLAGFAGALLPGAHARFDGPRQVEIGLIATAIHYDLLLPLDDELRARFGFAAADGVGVLAPDAGWLLVGWGAQGFYTSAGTYADIPLGAVAKGAFGDVSVLRLEAWVDLPLAQFNAESVMLTKAGYAALLDRIEAEIAPPRRIMAPGLSDWDAFYAGHTRFSALNTCNVWMGQALRAAGVPLGAWTPTPQALRLSLALWN